MKTGPDRNRDNGDALGGLCDVLDVSVSRNADASYRFDVTIRSRDQGWHSFADAFEIMGPGAVVLGKRILAHPHETEQPFTRSLDMLVIPDGIETVTVRAHHKVYGFAGNTVNVSLP